MEISLLCKPSRVTLGSLADVRSPVSGTVISRSVDVGQTVAASLQAPVLFSIAQDLRRMEVNIAVDEAAFHGLPLGLRTYDVLELRFQLDPVLLLFQ